MVEDWQDGKKTIFIKQIFKCFMLKSSLKKTLSTTKEKYFISINNKERREK